MSNEEKTALELEREQMEKDATAVNAGRSGVGTRVKVGSTRGKATQNIKYEYFDESQPDTLPKSLKEFCNTVGLKLDSDGTQLVPLLITGYNDQQYTEASDPIAEYLNPAWGDDVKTQFRIAVRSIFKMQDLTLAEVVAMVKPGTERKFLASQKSA